MSNKIGVLHIVKDHFKTLVNDNTNRPDGSDYLSFLVLPGIIVFGLLYFKVFISDNFVDTIISALSIFVGLLLNVIVLLFDIIRTRDSRNFKIEFVKDVLANITFTILLSIACILLVLTTQINPAWLWCKIQYVTNGISYFFLTLFLFTLLMVVKRMYALFENEIKENTKPGNGG